MAYQNEGRAALASRRPSGCLSRQNDTPEVALTTLEIQAARLRARFDFSPAVAAAIAELAFASPESWRASR